MAKKKRQETDPKEERARIGTPAGENPEEGRKRHGTEPLTEDTSTLESINRGAVEESTEDFDEEDFTESGYEISTTGGITGTHVTGGAIPAGGRTEGGTQGSPRHYPTVDEKT